MENGLAHENVWSLLQLSFLRGSILLVIDSNDDDSLICCSWSSTNSVAATLVSMAIKSSNLISNDELMKADQLADDVQS